MQPAAIGTESGIVAGLASPAEQVGIACLPSAGDQRHLLSLLSSFTGWFEFVWR